MLQESDERAAGLYYTGHSSPLWDVDGYYLVKKEEHSIVALPDPRYRPDQHVHVAGGRVLRRAGPWTMSSETAMQWGRRSGDIPLRAWGGNWQLKRVISQAHNSYVSAGFEALSGDDPSTPARNEGWNPMFGRFVKPSELYLYSGMYENGLAYWSDLRGFLSEAGIDVSRSIRLKGGWNRFTAPQCFRGSPAIFADGGHVRGNNLQTKAEFRLSPSWKAHILLERMLPGNFYAHKAPGYFLRFETSFQIRTILAPKQIFRRSS
jgi:hypothetical protein